MADKPSERRFSPYDAREVDKPLSNCDALFSVLKCVVGTGCLAMPLAFYYVGYIGGLILTVLIIALLIYGLQLLISCMVESSRRNMVGYMNFPDTMTYAISVGPKCCHCFAICAGHFVNAILIFSHYGICVVYIVFTSVNIKQVVDYNSKEVDIRIYCFLVGMLSIPLFLVRHLKYLVPSNIIATLLLYTGYACIFYYFFQNLPPIQEIDYVNTHITLFLGILMFATSSVGVMLAIESQMGRPAAYLGWFGVLNRASVIVALTYMIFGFFGYWRYGKYAAASITLNMPTDEALAQVIKIFIAIAVFLSFPLSGYVVVDILCKQYIIKRRNITNPIKVEYICRGVFVLACTVNAIAFPNLGPLVELLGAFTISLLNIVFPCWIEICLLYDFSYGAGRWRLVKDIILILFGLVVLGYGSYSAIFEMADKYGHNSHSDTGLSTKIKGPDEINAQYDAATLDYPIVDHVTIGERVMGPEFYL